MLKRIHISERLVFQLILTILIIGCKEKDEPVNQIPNVYVNFYLQPDGIDFIPPQGWKYINEAGYRGVLVYRVDQFTFNAYERACSFDPQRDCARVEVDGSGILLVDSCCMSYFNILDGMATGGPASLPLKQYFTEYNGTFLHVFNAP